MRTSSFCCKHCMKNISQENLLVVFCGAFCLGNTLLISILSLVSNTLQYNLWLATHTAMGISAPKHGLIEATACEHPGSPCCCPLLPLQLMRRIQWASQSLPGDESLSALILGGSLWKAADHPLLLLLCILIQDRHGRSSGWIWAHRLHSSLAWIPRAAPTAGCWGCPCCTKHQGGCLWWWRNRSTAVGAQKKDIFDVERCHHRVSTYRDHKEWLSFYTDIEGFFKNLHHFHTQPNKQSTISSICPSLPDSFQHVP